MSFRTLETMIASVQRSLAFASIPIGEIQEALDTANKKIAAVHSWPWLYAETNIAVPDAISDGSLALRNGLVDVYGLDTGWPTTTPYCAGRRIKAGNTNVDYIVSSATTTATHLTLVQAPNIADNKKVIEAFAADADGAIITSTDHGLSSSTQAPGASYIVGGTSADITTVSSGVAAVLVWGCTGFTTFNNTCYEIEIIDEDHILLVDATYTSGYNASSGYFIQNLEYTMYGDTYQMPTDWEPGSDIYFGQPSLRMRIKHIPRYHFEKISMALKTMQTNLTQWYTDSGFDYTTGAYTIRLLPPVSTKGEYRMVYRKKPPDLTTTAGLTGIPEGFDEVVGLHAEEELRRRYNLPGRQECQEKAAGLLKMLRQKVTSTLIDNQAGPSGTSTDSSFSQWGLTISPWST